MTRICPDCKIRPLEKGCTYCSECGEVRQYYSLLKAKLKYESKPETKEKMKRHRRETHEEYLKYQRDYYYKTRSR